MTSLCPLRQLAHSGSRVVGSALAASLVLREPAYWHIVRDYVTPARVLAWFGPFRPSRIVRREIPGLAAFHFVFEGIAGAGRGHDLSFDAEGRALAQRLLDMPVAVPPELAAKLNPPSPRLPA